ncbi:hypothetical protein F5Y01DRAFT_310973 [Xylaria sp. FL0043]|nr:hypothetical protein F5Y01DRAFT_310973 [Xylaria sp. FL0043]
MGLLEHLRTHRITYHRISLSEQKSRAESDEDAGEQPKYPDSRTIIVSIIILVLTVSLIIVSTLYINLLRQHAPRPLLTCGKSIEEAREAGCSFDRLTKTWLPSTCSRDYEEQFLQYPSTLNISEWKYWSDLSAAQEITDDDMAVFAETKSRVAASWVSTMRMHLAHCAFGLMRRSDMLETGDRIDLALAPLDHAHHCIRMLLDTAMRAPGIDAPIAQGGVIFGAC